MQSWRLLQLEPTALRAPDPFRATSRIGADGGHVPATLARLGKSDRKTGRDAESAVYVAIANRLAELTEGVRTVRVDEDERRELLTLVVKDLQGTDHEARALSDGTLRFLALAVLAEDPEAKGLICLEEPENGIHPERIPAMLRMLQDLSVDTDEAVGPDNPLRQVIVNTHSPAVVSQVRENSLVLVKPEPRRRNGGDRITVATFRWFGGTWRDELIPGHALPNGDLLVYLNPASLSLVESAALRSRAKPPERVIDRPEIRQLALFPEPSQSSDQ
jgi:predicted ATPase